MLRKEAAEIIRFENMGLLFENGPQVFNKLNLSVKEGSFYFLTGPSGVGKSTLLKMIYLNQNQTAGKVELFGRDSLSILHQDIPYIRRKIGVVFQDFRLVPHLNSVDNVALPLKVRGIDPRKARNQAAELLKWVGLEDVLNRNPQTLSGGQQQRIAIARAVIGRPKVLLADEPTGNVDDEIALKLLYLFEEMNKTGTTVIVATHNRALPKEFNHPEIYLNEGKATLIPVGGKKKAE
tara:strand:- start:5093 stop:5800 length:708 start_codon:yes stop_codon:yes gene_type:complete